jgi:putative oxidoreductase
MKNGMNPELGLAILRIVLGVIFVAHGWPKVGDMAGTAAFLGGVGIPAPMIAAWLVTILELGGGILLLAGFLVTPVALFLTAHMFLGIITVHAAKGFYVVGLGSAGIEFNLLMAVSLLMLVFGGPGLAALDSRNHS